MGKENTCRKQKTCAVLIVVQLCPAPSLPSSRFLRLTQMCTHVHWLSVIKKKIKETQLPPHTHTPLNIWHTEGICNSHISLLTLPFKHSPSLTQLTSASPSPFFSPLCLFFICAEDLTHTVSWRLLLSQQSSDSTHKDFNIFFIVLRCMIHSLLGKLVVCVFFSSFLLFTD